VRKPKEAAQYWGAVSPLLHDTNVTLATAAAHIAAIAPAVSAAALPLFE
jgi:hypothetical protein